MRLFPRPYGQVNPRSRGAADSKKFLRAPKTRGAQHLTRTMTANVFVRAIRSTLLCASPEKKLTLKLSDQTGSSSCQELNRPETFSPKTRNPCPGMTPGGVLTVSPVEVAGKDVVTDRPERGTPAHQIEAAVGSPSGRYRPSGRSIASAEQQNETEQHQTEQHTGLRSNTEQHGTELKA